MSECLLLYLSNGIELVKDPQSSIVYALNCPPVQLSNVFCPPDSLVCIPDLDRCVRCALLLFSCMMPIVRREHHNLHAITCVCKSVNEYTTGITVLHNDGVVPPHSQSLFFWGWGEMWNEKEVIV